MLVIDSDYASKNSKANLSKTTLLCCCFAACLTASTRHSFGMNARDVIQTCRASAGRASNLGPQEHQQSPAKGFDPMKGSLQKDAPTPALGGDPRPDIFGAAEGPLPHQHGHEKSKVIQRAK